jgi:hypothetical protein
MLPSIPLRRIQSLSELHHRRRHRQRASLLRPVAIVPLHRIQIAALARALCVLELALAAGVPDTEGEGYGEDEDCDAEDDERD